MARNCDHEKLLKARILLSESMEHQRVTINCKLSELVSGYYQLCKLFLICRAFRYILLIQVPLWWQLPWAFWKRSLKPVEAMRQKKLNGVFYSYEDWFWIISSVWNCHAFELLFDFKDISCCLYVGVCSVSVIPTFIRTLSLIGNNLFVNKGSTGR